MHISYAVPLSISLLASSIVAQSIVSVDVVSYPASVASSNIADVAAATQAPSAPLAGPSPPYANSSMPSILPSDNSGNSLVGSQKIWAVKVGSPDGKFVFSPEVIFAQPGELVQFQFYARNHSVVSSYFDTPCVPNSMPQGQQKVASNAFYSGFFPTAAEGSLTYTIPVVDQQPMWFYCSQGPHCQMGMVGVVNPPTNTNQTFDAYKSLAKAAKENITPSGPPTSANSGSGKTGPPSNVTTPTQTGQVAQTTRSAASIVGQVSWGLFAAAAVACFML